MSEKYIVGEDITYSVGRNYAKIAIMSELARGNKPVIVDDGEEYKSLCDNIGVEYTEAKQTD